MIIHKLSNMKNGWFIGNFNPTAYDTKDFEVCYRIHPKGEIWDTHYHTTVTEINLLITGKMTLQNTVIESGDIFVLYPFEIANPIFLEDCSILCIKNSSLSNDKIVIK